MTESPSIGVADSTPTTESSADNGRSSAAPRGITDEPPTHGRESPTSRALLESLEEFSEHPTEHVIRTSAESEKLHADADWLLDQLRPVTEGGQFATLARESEFDIRTEDVIYLDLAQQGGSLGGHTSLLMELLISMVYEHVKATDQGVVFVIDVARYIMQDAETLEYLETIFRHHRHHDLSIRLVTQTFDEFLVHEIVKIILDHCSVTQFYKLDGMNDEITDAFGLKLAKKRFVETALPGEDGQGHSEALVGVDGEWRGIEVEALEDERAVIDDEATYRDTCVPGPWDRGRRDVRRRGCGR